MFLSQNEDDTPSEIKMVCTISKLCQVQPTCPYNLCWTVIFGHNFHEPNGSVATTLALDL